MCKQTNTSKIEKKATTEDIVMDITTEYGSDLILSNYKALFDRCYNETMAEINQGRTADGQEMTVKQIRTLVLRSVFASMAGAVEMCADERGGWKNFALNADLGD